MFQGGSRTSIPKPAPRNLEDLDSVQRVLLHRSVWLPGCNQSGRRSGIRLGAGLLSRSGFWGLAETLAQCQPALDYKKLSCLSSCSALSAGILGETGRFAWTL